MIDQETRDSAARELLSARESLRFERLLSELSAHFINLPASRVDESIEGGLRRIVETLDIDRSTLNRVSLTTGRVEVTHSFAVEGLDPVPKFLQARESAPWSLAMAASGQPVVFSRLDDLPPEAKVDRVTFQRIGLKSHVTMPVIVAGQLHGGLSFGCIRRERSWPDDLLARLRLLAEIFANALARKRAQEDVERALGFERLLADISASLLRGAAGNLDNAIAKALRSIGEFLDVDRALLWSLSGDRERYELVHHWVANGVAAPSAIAGNRQASTLFGRVSRGEVVALTDVDGLPSEADADKRMLRDFGTRALLVVPLMMDGVTGGAFSLTSVRGTHAWPDTLIPRVRLIGEVFASVLARQRSARQIEDAQIETAQYRERLAHLVRVHTVGEMSAAIAHEINQPLVAIENYAQAARRRLASDGAIAGAKLEELLDKIGTQAARAGDVLKRLRTIVKKHESAGTECDLGKLVTDTVKLVELESRLRETHVNADIEPGLPPVFADEVQIQQVVLNLARNAVEAMGEAGVDDRTLVVEVASCGESELVVRVVDRGPGVGPEEAERIFEPFYSTKGTGLGIGLGICRAIVEAHGGRLSHLPNPGGGAIFQFTLPIAVAGD